MVFIDNGNGLSCILKGSWCNKRQHRAWEFYSSDSVATYKEKTKSKRSFHILSDRINILVLLIIIANKTNIPGESPLLSLFFLSAQEKKKIISFGTERRGNTVPRAEQHRTPQEATASHQPTKQGCSKLAMQGKTLGQGWKNEVRPISQSSLRFTVKACNRKG